MTEPTATTATDAPTAARGPKWWTLVAVCLGVFILLLDITIVNVALVNIQDDLGASLSDLQWVIDAYALSLAALLLTAGSLADLYGRRLVFVIGTALFLVGSVACGAAQDIFFLQASRAFQGIGGAAMFATALALIASGYQGRGRGIAVGALRAARGGAAAASRSAPSARRRASRSRSVRCSAAFSPAASPGGGSSSSTSRSACSRSPFPSPASASRTPRARGDRTGSASSPSASPWARWSTA